MSTDDLELVKEGGELSDDYYIHNYVSGITYCYFYNTDESSPCSDVRVRQAIGYAIDTDYIIQVVWTGEAQATHEVGASSLQDYDPAWDTEDNYYQYDVDKAKELLAEAGYADGLDLVLNTTSGNSNLAVVLQALLAQVGIDVEIQIMDQAVANQYKESDHSCWDIGINQVGSEDFMYNAFDKAYPQDKYSWEGTAGYWVDEDLKNMISNLLSAEGHSDEALQEVHEYTVGLALMYGIANKYSNMVLKSGLIPVLSSTGQNIYYGAFYWSAE